MRTIFSIFLRTPGVRFGHYVLQEPANYEPANRQRTVLSCKASGAVNAQRKGSASGTASIGTRRGGPDYGKPVMRPAARISHATLPGAGVLRHMRKALVQMLKACDYAAQLQCNLWDFAAADVIGNSKNVSVENPNSTSFPENLAVFLRSVWS